MSALKFNETLLEFDEIPQIPEVSEKQMDYLINLIKSMSSEQLNRYFTVCKGGKQLNPENDSFHRIDEDKYEQYILKQKQAKLKTNVEE